MRSQNLKFVALPVPEIIGGTPKIGQFLDTPTLPFLPNFSWAFVGMDAVNVARCYVSIDKIILISKNFTIASAK